MEVTSSLEGEIRWYLKHHFTSPLTLFYARFAHHRSNKRSPGTCGILLQASYPDIAPDDVASIDVQTVDSMGKEKVLPAEVSIA